MSIDLQRATAFYEEYYEKNPDASIDMAAKAADKAGAPILKEVASKVRQKVLDMKRTKADWKILPDPVGPKPFVVPESWSQPKSLEVPVIPVEIAEKSDREERIQFSKDLLEADPSLLPAIIQGKVTEKFGKGVDIKALYEMVRSAREAHGLPQIPYRVDPDGRASPSAPPDPVSESLRTFVSLLKEAGIRPESLMLTISRDWEVEFTYDRIISSSGKLKL